MNTIKFIPAVAMAALIAAGPAVAQQGGAAGAGVPPQNVLQLSASGSVEVQQDLLSITLTTTRDAADAAAVQAQLRSAVDAALAEARKDAQAGQLDVRTGNFSLSPRYSREGKINGWQGMAELVLDGRDFQRISRAADRIGTMSVGQVEFALSREQRLKSEAQAQQLAIENFKQKATELAKGFGFGAYALREVAVSASQGNYVQPRMMAASKAYAASSSDKAVPVEAGKASVVVNVSGTVQLK